MESSSSSYSAVAMMDSCSWNLPPVAPGVAENARSWRRSLPSIPDIPKGSSYGSLIRDSFARMACFMPSQAPRTRTSMCARPIRRAEDDRRSGSIRGPLLSCSIRRRSRRPQLRAQDIQARFQYVIAQALGQQDLDRQHPCSVPRKAGDFLYRVHWSPPHVARARRKELFQIQLLEYSVGQRGTDLLFVHVLQRLTDTPPFGQKFRVGHRRGKVVAAGQCSFPQGCVA